MIGALEGILFVVGNEGIEKSRLLEILNIESNNLERLLDELKNLYSSSDRGIDIEFFGTKCKLVTKKIHKEYYEKLVEVEKNEELSQAALETLAIIAYNDKVTRSYIDEIRGVDSSYQIKKLMYRNLVHEVGRSELPGRPILYAVTTEFLDYLGIKSINDLPKLEEVEIDEDVVSDLYSSKYKEN